MSHGSGFCEETKLYLIGLFKMALLLCNLPRLKSGLWSQKRHYQLACLASLEALLLRSLTPTGVRFRLLAKSFRVPAGD